MISVNIDVKKLDKTAFYTGEKGTYVNLTLIETPDSEYGHSHMVVQDLGKERREAGERGPILGNAKTFGDTPKPKAKASSTKKKEKDEDPFEDEVPF